MVGREVRMPARAPARGRGELVARLSRACAGQGRAQLRGADLELHAGEIVAIAGVSGNGQSTLAGLLCGTLACVRGEALFLGRPLTRPIAALVADGLARIPEDRHGTGVIGDLPLWENAVAERLRSPAFSHRAGGVRWVRREAARAYARETLTRATPLILTGLAAAVAFRARLFNIGAEGQLYAGALAAVAVGGLHGGSGFDCPGGCCLP
jgi:ABC-type uncharacterized transport system ATPase subunit